MKFLNYTKQTLFFIALLVIIAVNYLFSYVPFKLDFSKGRTYSLSSSSKTILRNLKGNAVITLYISPDLPANVSPVKRDIMDLLDEYKNYAGNKLKVIVKDPSVNPNIEEEALNAGVLRIQFSDLQQDQYSIKNGYIGAAISYGGKTEAAPTLLNSSTLEYEISSALYRLNNPIDTSVGLITRDSSVMTRMREVVGKQITITPLMFESLETFTSKNLVYKDDRVSELTSEQITQLKNFVSKGGTLFVLADGMWVNDALIPNPAKSNINNLLKEYDIAINKDLVWSKYAETVMFQTGAFNVGTHYPYWVRVGSSFMPGLSFARADSVVVLPWASTISAKGEGVTELLVLNKGTYILTNDLYLVPTQLNLQKLPKESRAIVGIDKKLKKGRIIVIANSRFIEDAYAGSVGFNFHFFTKLLDTYASDGLLSGISVRGVDYQPITQVGESTKRAVKYAVILIPSLVLIGYGILRMYLRKNS